MVFVLDNQNYNKYQRAIAAIFALLGLVLIVLKIPLNVIFSVYVFLAMLTCVITYLNFTGTENYVMNCLIPKAKREIKKNERLALILVMSFGALITFFGSDRIRTPQPYKDWGIVMSMLSSLVFLPESVLYLRERIALRGK